MSNDQTKDELYASPLDNIGQFAFDEKVAAVFPDMIKRSVPGYSTVLNMLGDIAERFAQANSNCYDLGCSLGAGIMAMQQRIRAPHCHIIGIDNSQAMIERCQTVTDEQQYPTKVTLHCKDINDTQIESASIVVLNFTLQFIAPSERQQIIQRIFDGLMPGGILLISEKIVLTDPIHQRLMTDLYHNFKQVNGYSMLEIAQKRTALENVLAPDKIEIHIERLKRAGFTRADTWFQCFTFASLIAIKS